MGAAARALARADRGAGAEAGRVGEQAELGGAADSAGSGRAVVSLCIFVDLISRTEKASFFH